MALIEKLERIGDAIRKKTGKTEQMTLDQMPTEIRGISTGGSASGTIDIIENGTYDVAEFATANVNVGNYIRFTGQIVSTISGSGSMALLAQDSRLTAIAHHPNLMIRVTANLETNTPYTLVRTIACNDYISVSDQIRQYVKAYGGSGEDSGNSYSSTLYNNIGGAGSLYINGEHLWWIVGSTYFLVRPCSYTVEVMW